MGVSVSPIIMGFALWASFCWPYQDLNELPYMVRLCFDYAHNCGWYSGDHSSKILIINNLRVQIIYEFVEKIWSKTDDNALGTSNSNSSVMDRKKTGSCQTPTILKLNKINNISPTNIHSRIDTVIFNKWREYFPDQNIYVLSNVRDYANTHTHTHRLQADCRWRTTSAQKFWAGKNKREILKSLPTNETSNSSIPLMM